MADVLVQTAPKETEIAAAALLALAPQWAEHWPEVPSLTGRVDIVGRDASGDLHAVECKTQPSLALAAQAVARMGERAFASVLCVVGQSDKGRRFRENTGVSDLVTLGTALGFGVAFVRRGTFNMELPPRPLTVEDGPKAEISRALNDIHREVAGAAGGQSSAYWTVWKQGLHELEQAVAAEPGVTSDRLRWKLELTKTLYWQNHARQVRALADQSTKVRAEFTGRQYHYFPVEPANV